MTFISIGAEAVISKKGDRVFKERIPKKYRLPALDDSIRFQRTRREAKLLHRLHGVVRVPTVYGQSKDTLELEFIDGFALKNKLSLANCKKTGELVGKMHAAHVVHGDLTTSNVLVEKTGVCLVDFGLAFASHKTEDFATDVHVFQELVPSSFFAAFWQGYRQNNPAAVEVEKRLEKINTRGRNKKSMRNADAKQKT